VFCEGLRVVHLRASQACTPFFIPTTLDITSFYTLLWLTNAARALWRQQTASPEMMERRKKEKGQKVLSPRQHCHARVIMERNTGTSTHDKNADDKIIIVSNRLVF
jgi:hypothetical protein